MIASFLAVEKSSMFLLAVLDKAACIASRELQVVEVARQAQGVSVEVLKERRTQLEDRFRQMKEGRDQSFSEIRDHARQSATTALGKEFASLVSRQRPTLREQLDREMNEQSGWRPVRGASGAAGHVFDRFWATMIEWGGDLRPRLEEPINQAIGPAKASLEWQLAAISATAVSLVRGLPDDAVRKPEDAEPLPSLALPLLAMRKPLWVPRISGILGYVPAALGRRHLRECFHNQLEEAIAVCRAEASKAVQRT